MRVLALPRRRGKTMEVLKWLADAPEGEHRVLVSQDLMESHRVQRLGMKRGLESWQFVALSEVTPTAWSGVLRGRGGRVVLGLDNLDLMLPWLLGWPVSLATVTLDAAMEGRE